jgi:CubicO group peptidase (beta-lactamase class C family)
MSVAAAPTDIPLPDLTEARDVADRLVRRGSLPCVVFGVADAAGRTSTHAVASAGLRAGADAIFFLASLSKGIVATAVMQYVDEGRLDLHAPLARYLPEIETAPAGRVTAWHVLTHTSGLPDIPVETLRRERPSYRGTLERVLASRPAWEPGTRYAYNSAVWVLLSETMARLSGMPFPDALERRLTRPLGMADTSFDPRRQRSRVVAVRGGRMDNRIVQELLLRFLARSRMPGGGLFASLPDLLRLGAALLPADPASPAPRILSQATIDEMARSQTAGLMHEGQDGRLREVRQGLGWRKPQPDWPGSERVFTHGGISGGRLWIDPEAGFSCAFLTNLWQAPLEPALEVIAAIYRGHG